jgi:hypothetical protein
MGPGDGPADGREPPVLSALESAAARAWVSTISWKRGALALCGDDGPVGLPPGIYFRLLLIGYFEGIDAERGIAWRAADSLALRDFVGIGWTKRRRTTRRFRGPGASSRSKRIGPCLRGGCVAC